MTKTVLIVGVERDVYQTIEEWLSGRAADCVFIEEYKEAMTLILREKPWILVLNVDDLAGRKFAQKIRMQTELSNLKLVALSSGVDPQVVTEHVFGDSFADCYVRLPLKRGVLDQWFLEQLSGGVPEFELNEVELGSDENNNFADLLDKIERLETENFEKAERLALSTRNMSQLNRRLQEEQKKNGVEDAFIEFKELEELEQEQEQSSDFGDGLLEAKATIQDLQEVRDIKVAQINQLHVDLQLSREAVSTLELRVDKAEGRLEEAQSLAIDRDQHVHREAIALQRQLSALQHNLQATQNREAELNQKIGRLQFNLDGFEEAEAEILNLQERLRAELEKKPESVGSDMLENASTLDGQSIEGFAALEKRLQDAEQERLEVERKLSLMEERSVEQDQKIANLEKQHLEGIENDLPPDIKKLQMILRDKEEEIERQQIILEQTYDALEQAVEEQEKLERVLEAVQKNKLSLDALELDILQASQQRLQQTQEDLAQTEEKYTALTQNDIVSEEQSLVANSAEREALEKENQNLENAKQVLEEENQNLIQSLKVQEEAFQIEKEKWLELKTESTEISNVEANDEQLNEYLATIAGLKKEVQSAGESAEHIEAEKQSLEQEKQNLIQSLKDQEEDFSLENEKWLEVQIDAAQRVKRAKENNLAEEQKYLATIAGLEEEVQSAGERAEHIEAEKQSLEQEKQNLIQNLQAQKEAFSSEKEKWLAFQIDAAERATQLKDDFENVVIDYQTQIQVLEENHNIYLEEQEELKKLQQSKGEASQVHIQDMEQSYQDLEETILGLKQNVQDLNDELKEKETAYNLQRETLVQFLEKDKMMQDRVLSMVTQKDILLAEVGHQKLKISEEKETVVKLKEKLDSSLAEQKDSRRSMEDAQAMAEVLETSVEKEVEEVQQEKQELEKEKQGLEKEKQGLEQEKQELEKEKQGLEQEKQDLSEHVKTLEEQTFLVINERDDALFKTEELNNKISHLQDEQKIIEEKWLEERNGLLEQGKELTIRIDDTKEQLSETLRENYAATSKIAILENELDLLSKERASVLEEGEEIQKNLEESLSALDADKSRLLEEKEQLEQDLKTERASFEEKYAQAQIENTADEDLAQIEALKQSLAEKEVEQSELQRLFDEQGNTISALESAIVTLEEKSAELQQSIKENEEAVEVLKETSESSSSISEEFAIAALLNQLDALSEKLTKKNGRIQELEQEDKNSVLVSLQIKCEDLEDEVQTLELERGIVQSTSRELIQKTQVLKAKSQKRQAQLLIGLKEKETEIQQLKLELLKVNKGLSSIFVSRPRFHV